MSLFIRETSFDPPITPEAAMEVHQRLQPCLQLRNVRWIHTYASPDMRRSMCVYEAADAESVREALRSAKAPFDRVWPAHLVRAEDFAAPPGAVAGPGQ